MAAEMQDIAQELNQAISNNEIDLNDILWSSQPLPEKFGPVKVVFSDRIGSDYDQYKVVFYIESCDTYVSLIGSYTSYDGADLSYAKFYEVKAVEKTIIEYV